MPGNKNRLLTPVKNQSSIDNVEELNARGYQVLHFALFVFSPDPFFMSGQSRFM